MRKKYIMLWCALGLGSLGALLRSRQLAAGFEEATGLPVPGSVPAILLAVLSVLAAAGALLGGYLLFRRSEVGEDAFERDRAVSLITAAAGAVMLASAVLSYIEGYPRTADLVRKVFAATAALTGACVIYSALSGPKAGGRYFAVIVPELFFCFWLAVTYRTRATSSVLTSYCYECFAFAAATMAFYYEAGFTYRRGRSVLTAAFIAMALVFLGVTLADSHPVAVKLYVCGTMIVLAEDFITFTRNTERTSPPENGGDTQENENPPE